MDEIMLTVEEKQYLVGESENSKIGRRRYINNALTILITSLTVFVVILFIDKTELSEFMLRLLGGISVIAVFMVVFGLFNIYYWGIKVKLAINKLDHDIAIGKKIVARLTIIGYNHFSRTIKLNNGLVLEKHDLADGWKKGDLLDLEYLPTSTYIFKCDKTAR